MAGISRYYYVGKAGGFLGSDGLNGKDIEIAVWEGDRRALVVHYLSSNLEPLSKELTKFIPHGPNDKDQERIALILFASNLFKDCPSYEIVKKECEGISYIDFSSKVNVPSHFYDLLEESRDVDLSEMVNMYYADLVDVVFKNSSIS